MKLLCFGDSNTFGYDPRSVFGSRYENPWVDILSAKTGWKVINAGQNGREIPRRSFELAAFRALVDRCDPELTVILLGTNDLLQGADPETVTARMEGFLRQVTVPVLLVAPPPLQRGAWVVDDGLVAASRLLGERYRQLAAHMRIPFVDSGDWKIPLSFDGVHFSEDGHRIFADHLLAVLKRKETAYGLLCPD